MSFWEVLKKNIYKKDAILSWYVCVGMFICNVIVYGIDISFGEMLRDIVNEFNSDNGSVGSVSSMNSYVQCCSAFLSSLLTKRLGFRTIIFFDGATDYLAIVLAFFSSDV